MYETTKKPQDAYTQPVQRKEAALGVAGKAKRHNPYAGVPLRVSNQVAGRIRKSFGIDPGELALRESPEVAGMGARATAQGNVIRFAPGEFKPETEEGMEVLGHELSHVREQASGKVRAPGGSVFADPGHEARSDRAGAAFAMGSLSAAGPVSVGNVSAEAAPVQGLFGSKRREFKKLGQHLQGSYRDARVNPTASRAKKMSDFLVAGGNRDDQTAEFRKYKARMGNMSQAAFSTALPQHYTANAQRMGSVAGFFNASDENRTNAALSENADFKALSGDTLDMMMNTASGMMDDRDNADIFRRGAGAFRSATAGREGEQDFFGNDANLAGTLLNNLNLYGISPQITLDANSRAGGDQGQRAATVRSTQMATAAMNKMFEVASGLGDREASDEELAEIVAQMNQSSTAKGQAQIHTLERLKNFIALQRKMQGVISPQQQPAQPQPGPQPAPAPEPAPAPAPEPAPQQGPEMANDPSVGGTKNRIQQLMEQIKSGEGRGFEETMLRGYLDRLNPRQGAAGGGQDAAPARKKKKWYKPWTWGR